MVTAQVDATLIPACPATVWAVHHFAESRFGLDLHDDVLQPALRRRERVIVDRRSAGDARGADVLGWLSLAAVLAGGTASLVSSLGRHSNIDVVLTETVADTGDGLGELAPVDGPPHDVVVCGLTVPDVGSRAGWALARFTGKAAANPSISVRGLPQSSSLVLLDIRARITTAAGVLS